VYGNAKQGYIVTRFMQAFLAISPWLFGFSNKVYLPHLIFGLIEMAAGMMTRDSSEVAVMSNGARN
jgi:hypothetical protein